MEKEGKQGKGRQEKGELKKKKMIGSEGKSEEKNSKRRRRGDRGKGREENNWRRINIGELRGKGNWGKRGKRGKEPYLGNVLRTVDQRGSLKVINR